MPNLRYPVLETAPKLIHQATRNGWELDNYKISGTLANATVESGAVIGNNRFAGYPCGDDAWRLSGDASATNQYTRLAINLGDGIDMSGDNLLGVLMGHDADEAAGVLTDQGCRFYVANNEAPSAMPAGYSSTTNPRGLFGSNKQVDQFFALHRDDFTLDAGAGVDWNLPIKCLVIELRSTAASSGTIAAFYRAAWYGWGWKDGIIPGFLNCDDGNITQLTEWRPRLLDRNMMGGLFTTTNVINSNSLFLNNDELHQMWREGFEVYNHNMDHIAMDGQDAATQLAQVQGATDQIRDWGIQSYEGILHAGPTGATNQDARETLQTLGFTASRSALYGRGFETCGIFGRAGLSGWNMRTINMGATKQSTAQEVIDEVTNAVKYQCPISVYGHNFIAGATDPNDFELTQLTAALDGILALDVAWVGYGSFIDNSAPGWPRPGKLLTSRSLDGAGITTLAGGTKLTVGAGGTFDGCTVTLQTSADATTWAAEATFTVAGIHTFTPSLNTYVRGHVATAGASTSVNLTATG